MAVQIFVKTLKNGCFLSDYNIQKELTLHGSMQVFIKTLTGKTIFFDIGSSDNIDYAKAEIQDRWTFCSTVSHLSL
jgi:ubiquitin C